MRVPAGTAYTEQAPTLTQVSRHREVLLSSVLSSAMHSSALLHSALLSSSTLLSKPHLTYKKGKCFEIQRCLCFFRTCFPLCSESPAVAGYFRRAVYLAYSARGMRPGIDPSTHQHEPSSQEKSAGWLPLRLNPVCVCVCVCICVCACVYVRVCRLVVVCSELHNCVYAPPSSCIYI